MQLNRYCICKKSSLGNTICIPEKPDFIQFDKFKISCKTEQQLGKGSDGYTTINKVITATCPPNEYPSNDVENTIDNNQKVGKHLGRIREGSKVPTSICTTVGYIVPKPETNLQNDESLMPKNWLDAEPIAEMIKKAKQMERGCLKEFRLYRGAFITEGLKNVAEEQRQNGTMHDYVDK